MRKLYFSLILLTCSIWIFFYLSDFARRVSWSELIIALQNVDVVEAARDQNELD